MNFLKKLKESFLVRLLSVEVLYCMFPFIFIIFVFPVFFTGSDRIPYAGVESMRVSAVKLY